MLGWLKNAFLVILGLFLTLIVFQLLTEEPEVPIDLHEQVVLLSSQGENQAAANLLRKWAERDDASSKTLLTIGKMLLDREKAYEESRKFLKRVPASSTEEHLEATAMVAESYLSEGRVAEAISAFEVTLALDPSKQETRTRLANIFESVGRKRDARPIWWELNFLHQHTEAVLLALASPEFPATPSELVSGVNADDPAHLLGAASLSLYSADWALAEQCVSRLLKLEPQSVEAHAAQGRLLVGMQRMAEIPVWNSALPTEAEKHADVWLVRGQWAEAQGQTDAAVRCYAEACLLDPRKRPAMLSLATLGSQQRGAEAAAELLTLAEQLQRMESLGNQLRASRTNVDLIHEMADLLESMNLVDETVGWANRASEMSGGEAKWAADMVARLRSEDFIDGLRNPESRTIPEDPMRAKLQSALKASGLDITRLPLPDWSKLGSPNTEG